jgi:glutaredoxin
MVFEDNKMIVELYTRAGCHLCEEAKAVIDRVHDVLPFELKVIDVDGDPKLQEQFGLEVPVVFIEGRKHAKYRLDERMFSERLRRGEAGGSAAQMLVPKPREASVLGGEDCE